MPINFSGALAKDSENPDKGLRNNNNCSLTENITSIIKLK